MDRVFRRLGSCPRATMQDSLPRWWTALLVFPIVLDAAVRCQMIFHCTENACDKGCRPLSCSGGRVIDNATTCGCCPICIKSLVEGAACHNVETASLPSQECGLSLTCSEQKCTPQTSKPCVRELQQGQSSKQASFEMAYGRPAPECDFFGDYRPKRCKKGLMCHCVDKEGRRIFGTGLHKDAESMDCGCSRLVEQQRALGVNAANGLRCLSNGNMDPLQCSDSHCFCIKKDGSLDGRPMPRGTPVRLLTCYRRDLRHGDLTSPCFREYQNATAAMKELKELGIIIVGLDRPSCDPDGTYAPRQCKADRCYCVRPNGRPYDNQEFVARYSQEAKEMTCNCLREKDMLHDADVPATTLVATFRRHRCARNGNYLPLQCTTSSSCRCVDQDGYQNSPDVMVSERHRLHCYKKELDQYFRDEIDELE